MIGIKELQLVKSGEETAYPYFTIVKEVPDKPNIHVHASTERMAKQIMDCYWRIKNGIPCDKYSLLIRDKAMNLCYEVTVRKL